MRGRWLVGLVGIACSGCYDPRPSANTTCSASGDCPAPLICDRGLCVVTIDAAIDAVPDAADPDRDSDGVANEVDNCPELANTDQHDEDQDARGDVCDSCPHLADATFADGDDDGVGDACDPNVTTPGDQIARFETFTALPPDLTTVGTWTIMGDEVVAAPASNVRLLVPGTHARVTAEIGGRIVSTPTSSRELKVVAGRTGASVWSSCALDDSDAGMGKYVLEIERETAGGTTIVAEPPRARMAVGPVMLRIRADATADAIDCVAVETGVEHTAAGNPAALAAGEIEVQARQTGLALAYLIVISSP